ncbi:hypothetical protein GDO81_013719 [Engystomops pustulosus]|uniref:Uncharacterized protein n=1 Tax=Engystomops pustulosus TaxID=76066 RepID=A0AAV7B526_ENGPU|nr:hypothetical protein GDO81_013719 [Engystomops pustulosus]
MDQTPMPYTATFWTQQQVWSQRMSPCTCVFSSVQKGLTTNYRNDSAIPINCSPIIMLSKL